MKLVKRVIISVLRRKSASLIILLITFLLGNVLAVSLSIEQSSLSVKENLMNSIGGKMIITTEVSSKDNVSFMEKNEYEEEMNLFYKIYNRMIDRNYIKYSDFNLHFSNITCVDDCKLTASPSSDSGSILHGVENENLIDEMEGILSLVEGRKFTKDEMENGDHVLLVNNKVMINGEKVKVGDVINFSTFAEGYNWNTNNGYYLESEPIGYKVVGIYQAIENKYSDVQNKLESFYVPNQCIVDFYKTYETTINESDYNDFYDSKMWVNSIIIHVNSPEKLDDLIYAADVYINDHKYDFTYETTQQYVSQLIGPINTFADVAGNVVIFSLVAMSLVVGLISFYFIRDRKYEIGIYMALGIKKVHLMSQIILEILIVGLLGITLSVGSGSILSNVYSDYLLDITINTYNEENDKFLSGMEMIDPNNIQQEDVLNQYEVVITVEDISNLYLLGVFTLVISSIFPLVYILRIKPKNVLLE